MNNQNFEKKLIDMTKPEISQLKHEDMLANTIINAKDKSVMSLWWLSVPLFIIMMLLMKSMYMPGSDLIANIHELAGRQKYMSLIFFLIAPSVLIILNALSVRKVYFLSGNPRTIKFLEFVWLNMVIIVLCVFILVIYSF